MHTLCLPQQPYGHWHENDELSSAVTSSTLLDTLGTIKSRCELSLLPIKCSAGDNLVVVCGVIRD